jgi:hypothetical protein
MSALLQMTIATDEMTDNPRAPAVPRFNPPLSVIAPAATPTPTPTPKLFQKLPRFPSSRVPQTPHHVALHHVPYIEAAQFFRFPASYDVPKPPQDVPATKILKCCQPSRFQPASFVCKPHRVVSQPQMLSRFQIPATKWPASSILEPTKMIQTLPVITPNFRFPAVTLSLNPPKMSLQLKTSNAV